jgi:hypothetical protein
VGDSVFSFGDLSPFFYLKKTLATNTKGVFHLKSQKTDRNFFGRGGRVPSHLCLLAAVLRVPSNNWRQLDEICLNLPRDAHHLTQSANWNTLLMDIPKMWGQTPGYHLLVGPLFRECLHRNRLPYTKGPPISGGKNMLGVMDPPITVQKLVQVFKFPVFSI